MSLAGSRQKTARIHYGVFHKRPFAFGSFPHLHFLVLLLVPLNMNRKHPRGGCDDAASGAGSVRPRGSILAPFRPQPWEPGAELHAHRACFVRTDRHAVREERSAALGRGRRVSVVPVMHASHTELCIGLAFSWGKIPVGAPAAFPTGFLLSKAVQCTLRKARGDRQLERCVSVLVFTFSLKC